MALYKITQDCRIANKDYKKGDVVSKEEVGWYFTTVMKEISDKKEEAVKDSPANKTDEPEIKKWDDTNSEKVKEKKPTPKSNWNKK